MLYSKNAPCDFAEATDKGGGSLPWLGMHLALRGERLSGIPRKTGIKRGGFPSWDTRDSPQNWNKKGGFSVLRHAGFPARKMFPKSSYSWMLFIFTVAHVFVQYNIANSTSHTRILSPSVIRLFELFSPPPFPFHFCCPLDLSEERRK